MKQQQDYFEAVRAWDRKHRIVGKTPIETLIKESIEALDSLPDGLGPTMIDVGAGAGVLGFPWLWADPKNRAVFVEMDPKKAAFLMSFISGQKELKDRAKALCARLEDVPRETIASDIAAGAFLAARAFSGSRSLKETIQISQISQLPAFDFVVEADPAKKISHYRLKPIDLSQ